MPASASQPARWTGYPEWYRTGHRGAMSPTKPPSRFHVESGAPYFDAAEDGTPVRHRLTEFRPGLFLADTGETLDLGRTPAQWRGLDLNPVTNGPRPMQWALLAVVAVVAAGWLVAAGAKAVRWQALVRPAASLGDRLGRRATVVVAAAGAVSALATAAVIGRLPGLVDVGFLGWMGWPLPVRLAFRLPLAVAVLAATLATLVTAGALRRWWIPRVRPLDAALAGALVAFAAQLAWWQVIA